MTDEKAGIKEEHEWLRRAYDELLEISVTLSGSAKLAVS